VGLRIVFDTSAREAFLAMALTITLLMLAAMAYSHLAAGF
jgi:hypothetical protein